MEMERLSNIMIKSFERMFSILGMFTMDTPSLSISEIERELNYPKSTIFRILNTLIKADYIVQNPDTHRYSLGMQFFRLGSIFQSQLDLRNISLPVMKQLAKDSLETVELNIIDETSRFCIEKIDSPLTVRNFVQIGDRHPLHLGASGKCLLAFLNLDIQNHLLMRLGEQYDVKIQGLKEDLKRIRNKGYAFTKGERVVGSFAVSAPLYDEGGGLIASITLSGPIQRLNGERENELINLLTNSATIISQSFGNFSIKS